MGEMKQGTSVQTGLVGMGKETAQVKAFEELKSAIEKAHRGRLI